MAHPQVANGGDALQMSKVAAIDNILFPKIKEILKGKYFDDIDDINM
jgi:hypothetical protein